jgi:hypothetical protein
MAKTGGSNKSAHSADATSTGFQPRFRNEASRCAAARQVDTSAGS